MPAPTGQNRDVVRGPLRADIPVDIFRREPRRPILNQPSPPFRGAKGGVWLEPEPASPDSDSTACMMAHIPCTGGLAHSLSPGRQLGPEKTVSCLHRSPTTANTNTCPCPCPCPQVNRSLKKARKADKKKARRETKRASLSPGKGAEGGGGAGSAYDFSTDFYAGGEGGGGELSDDDEL